jgi:hypothetical protein
VPEGVFTDYNAIHSIGWNEFLHLFEQHIYFFLNVSEPIEHARSLIRYDSILYVIALLLGAVAIATAMVRSGNVPNVKSLAILTVVGGVVLILGVAPYVAIGRIPQRVDFVSRFAVASQFGALILAAVAIQLLWLAPLRALVLASTVFIFSAVQLQMAKWMLYEELVLRDYQHQVGSYLEATGEQVLVVQFQPPTRDFLYRNRACLSSYDSNDGLDLAGQRHGSFVYDRDCGPEHYADPDGCRFTGFRQQRCPAARHSSEFRLYPGMEHFERFRLFDLARRAVFGSPFASGQLVPTN